MSQIRTRIEYLVPTFTIILVLSHSYLSQNVALLACFNTIIVIIRQVLTFFDHPLGLHDIIVRKPYCRPLYALYTEMSTAELLIARKHYRPNSATGLCYKK